ncbi:hypothetical protein B0I33_109223 [Prauserella shujinwangii]|uniref:Uncharacterized protein n=1 Tax=Prauserella shujinwangii TaxID=1453103 RepID=A0A2T0LQI8_9PSEU|nr:hypothetical protein [Prauserella shujinwangii]PRX45560.1 hypothetical protein B0I33_109223 [Prauserella shujinwangii]
MTNEDEPRRRPARLHQPWRVAVAAGEVLLAAVALWGAFVCWDASVTTVTMRLDDGTELVSRRLAGHLVTVAIALGTLAGIAVLDALRQLLLGLRVRRRRRRKVARLAHT